MYNKTDLNFGKELKRESWQAAVSGIIKIPITVFLAGLLSDVIQYAVEGDVSAVLKYMLTLLIVTIVLDGFLMSASSVIKKKADAGCSQMQNPFS